MASLDSLTDSEIRSKLIELGFNVGPVTGSTRSVYLKKLKGLLEQKPENERRLSYDPHGSVTQFSSGEESDEGSVGRSGRRRTMPPPKTSKTPRRKSPGRNEVPLASSTFVEPPTDTIDYDFRPSRLTEETFSKPQPNNTPPRFSSSALSNFSEGVRARSQIKSPQPYSSDFARRLSAISSRSTTGTPLSSRPLEIKESDDEDNGSVPVHTKISQSGLHGAPIVSRATGRTFSQEGVFRHGSPVSLVLVGVLILFFFLLAFAYLNMHSDTSVVPASGLKVPLCVKGLSHSEDSCVSDDAREAVIIYFSLLHKELFNRVQNNGCKGSEGLEPLTYREAVVLIVEKNRTLDLWKVEQDIDNLKALIAANPDWKLAVNENGISVMEVPVSFLCYLYNLLYVVSSWTIKILIATGVLLLVYVLSSWWMRRNERHKEEVYKMVTNILDIVSSKAQDTNNFVPINHVRDQLIPPKDRQRMAKLWNDAITMLDCDSRLRSEVQNVEGEEFLVWRWLASPLSPNNKRKVWQGQAFETVEGSVNSLPDSPTPCLKIRHMFDPAMEEGEEWVSTVVDAILEKCGEAKILHVVVDKQSKEGCVYVKCASQMDAGIAYRALHGSWFDSKLVTVKYIREKRYLERFPDSAKSSVPLQPSNNKKKSLQHQ